MNKKGELVGINTAIVSQTGAYSGYSFAVPVNIVKRVAGDLIDYGSVKRAMLGITMGSVDKKIADEMKLSSVSGVYINEVLKGSAAEKAGLKKNDVIVAIDGEKITDASSVQAKVSGYHPGDQADILYFRDGKEARTTVVFQAASTEGGIILFVNGDAVAKPSEVVAKAKKGARAVYIEGIDANGKTFYLAFGK